MSTRAWGGWLLFTASKQIQIKSDKYLSPTVN